MALELVTPLPPGAPSFTRLAKHGARLVVLREIKDGTDCSWPDPSPHMVTLQEVGELQGKRHALFPWVPGVTLRETIKALELAGKPTPLGLIARILVDAARALETITPPRAHGGINDAAMQIGFDGLVSVLDYGAPRISRFRPIGRVNFAADVFALGGVLHSALTGFQGDYASPPVTLPAPSTSHPEATPAIDDVVMRALSSQPDSRQASAGAFADELEAVLGDQLYTAAQLAEVVNTLFKERLKLIESLGGLIDEAPVPEPVLPPAPIPMGTQPGVGGGISRPEPPSEPTLPRIVAKDDPPALGEDPHDRTDTRIPVPVEAAPPSKPVRSMVPWDSADGLPRAGEPPSNGAAPPQPPTRPSGPPLSGPRPSVTARPALAVSDDDPATNPRGAVPREGERETNPRAVAPSRRPEPEENSNPRNASTKRPADTDENAGPRAAPAKRPADTDENSGPRTAPGRRPADTDESSSPRAAPAKRPADTDETSAPDLRPRASVPRPLGAEADHAPTRPSGPRALSRNDLEAARPRANVPPPSDSDLAPKTRLEEVPEDTNPRAPSPLAEDTSPRARSAKARRLEDEPDDTGPRPELPPHPRNTTEAERLRARGQERLRTPPQGVELGGGDEDEEERHEPTAVRPRIAPEIETAQTAQKLPPVPASSGNGLRVVMVLLLLVVVGLAGGVVLKLKRQSEQPLAPPEEPVAELDAGAEPDVDAGPPATDAGPAVLVPALDAGEDEDDEADAGAAVDAGPAPSANAGHPDAGVKKAVKKVVKKKKKGKH